MITHSTQPLKRKSPKRGAYVVVQCRGCGKDIHTIRSRITNGRGRHCSRACLWQALRKAPLPLTCERCSRTFYITVHHKKRNRRFCSQACFAAAESGETSHAWTGGIISNNGYRFVYIPAPERSNHQHYLHQGRYMLEHVWIVEKAIGRCLRKGEVVHHINGIKSDNRNSNLLVCSPSYHRWLHNEMGRRYALEKFGPPAEVA